MTFMITDVKSQHIRIIFTVLFSVLSSLGYSADFQIDSQESFDRLSKASFAPGDIILFKRGLTVKGMFAPQGDGTAEKPIKITVYGDGEDRPVIQAEGKVPAGIFLQNVCFWEVSGLEITNTDGSDNDQGDLFGIYILADKGEKVYEHIVIEDNYIHQVNGKVEGKGRGGIHVQIKKLKESRFHNLRIVGNKIAYVGGVGIGNRSDCGGVDVHEDGTYTAKNLWTSVYVADNHVSYTGRNCIIARVSKDAIYERNILAHSSRYSTGHSIFNFDTDNIKIQYNEAYGNVGDGGMDRGGFDADYNSVNTYIQYNYSHDNNWFCGIMKKPNHNVIIRHNISQNDKEGIYFYGFEGQKKATKIQIYNNTHFVAAGLSVKVFAEDRTPLNSIFEKNIFYFAGEGQWGKKAAGIRTSFDNNLYFNITPHPSDKRAQQGDPLFVKPGDTGTEINLKTMDALSGYQLKPASTFKEYGARLPMWQ